MNTPVLFLIFNRPELTFRVFEEIRKAQPQQLFIAADGPREGKEGEAGKCEQARSIVNKIDWKCEVKTLFRDKNLGCQDAVSSAITWFFDNVVEGIILEDDCLPDQSFFTFCETLLEKYRDNEKIMHIGGNNFQDGIKRGNASYYFSIHPHQWGWATWNRAWNRYNININGLENFKKTQTIFKHPAIVSFNMEKLEKTLNGEINTWDYQWFYTIWKNNGITIVPNVNLVTNIGFGENATHTFQADHFLAQVPLGKLDTILHPTQIKVNKKADDYYSWQLLRLKGSFDYYRFEAKKRSVAFIYPIYKKIFKQDKKQ